MLDWLTAAGVAFAGALFPLANVEAYVAAVVAAGSGGTLWVLCVLLAAGQMAGKLVWYYAGAQATRIGWVQAKMAKPRRAKQVQRWRTRVAGRPMVAAATVFSAGALGLPPLAVVSVLAGQLRLPVPLFVLTGLVGRFVRFAALAHGLALLPLA